MTLSRSKVLHICSCTSTTTKTQMSIHFPVRPAFSCYRHQMTPKWPSRSKVSHICPNTISKSEISIRFASRFRVTGRFETSTPNETKITLNTARSKTPHIRYTSTSWVQNITPFRSTDIRFWLSCHFETTAPNYPQITLTTRSNTLYLFNLYPGVPNLNPCWSMALHFRVTCHFEKSAANTPKALNTTKKSKLLHTCSISTPILELRAILRQVHWVALNNTGH